MYQFVLHRGGTPEKPIESVRVWWVHDGVVIMDKYNHVSNERTFEQKYDFDNETEAKMAIICTAAIFIEEGWVLIP